MERDRSLPPLRPYQEQARRRFWELYDAGERRLCLESPTGAGKSRIMYEVACDAVDRGLKVAVYSSRVSLTSQLLQLMRGNIGVRAAGFEQLDLRAPVQVCSLQTTNARAYKGKRWTIPEADIVIPDEIHMQRAKVATKVFTDHIEAGAALLGVSATPVNIGHLCTKKITAGSKSQLRDEGYLLPCVTYCPDEPDMDKLRVNSQGEFSPEQITSRMGKPKEVVARVLPWLHKLNPELKPTILFAPGVAESKWFADLLTSKGVSAAHIDGDSVYWNGKSYESSAEAREDVLQASKHGVVKVICNRFVLREAVDMPWLAHGIAATVFGSPVSFFQSGGRILRPYPGLDSVTWQCHGGSYWRHGSLNDDVDWDMGSSAASHAKERKKRIAEGKESCPVVCVRCGRPRRKIGACPECGYESVHTRCVRQLDGELKKVSSPPIRRKRVVDKTKLHWSKAFWSIYKGKSPSTRKMREALGYFDRLGGSRDELWDDRGHPRYDWLPHRNSLDWEMTVAKFAQKYRRIGGRYYQQMGPGSRR